MRLRRIGRKVEDELFDWADEEGGKEGPTRATLLTAFQGFLTLWKTSEATVYERVLGLAGFAGLAWFVTGDFVFGVKHRLLRLVAGFFAALWFIPGLIAAVATVLWGLGPENLKHWRTYPIMLAFACRRAYRLPGRLRRAGREAGPTPCAAAAGPRRRSAGRQM